MTLESNSAAYNWLIQKDADTEFNIIEDDLTLVSLASKSFKNPLDIEGVVGYEATPEALSEFARAVYRLAYAQGHNDGHEEAMDNE